LQLFDDDPPPQESHSDEIKKERLERAAAQKKKFQEDLSAQLIHVKLDHCYSVASNDESNSEEKEVVALPHLAKELYESHVMLSSEQISILEANTRTQSNSELWFDTRKLRITASIMKEVCHRKSTTNCEGFLHAKLCPAQFTTAAISYGKQHENDAISSYIHYKKCQGINVEVAQCGLVVDKVEFWLAASPDGITTDPTQQNHKRGCLEVKCPFTCKNMTILEACKQVLAFCLVEQKGVMRLSESHAYYYQIQTQMHVTNFKWCDFVIWCPKQIFVHRIWYDSAFMKNTLQTAKNIYFNTFLPSVAPCMIIKSTAHRKPQIMCNLPTHPVEAVDNKSSGSSPHGSLLPHHSLLTDSGSKLLQSAVTSGIVKCDTADDIQVVGATKTDSMSLQAFLLHMKARKHVVKGDGNCLYHSIAHQAGLISLSSDGNDHISQQLRKIAECTMWKYPDIRKESGLTVVQWLQKTQEILQNNNWGGDTELRLLAIGIQRDIIVVTSTHDQACTFARKYPCRPPPLPKMRGGIFIPLATSELCNQWNTMNPRPLVIIFNGQNHFDSMVF